MVRLEAAQQNTAFPEHGSQRQLPHTILSPLIGRKRLCWGVLDVPWLSLGPDSASLVFFGKLLYFSLSPGFFICTIKIIVSGIYL